MTLEIALNAWVVLAFITLFCSIIQLIRWLTVESKQYYIRHQGYVGNCLVFWRNKAAGYTCNLDEAMIVSRSEAKALMLDPEIDNIIPRYVVDKVSKRHVDIQHLSAWAENFKKTIKPLEEK